MSPKALGVAVPYRSPSLIADNLGPGGQRRMYYESFDEASWRALRPRVPLNRAHDRDRPLGWAKLDSRDDGLYAEITWIEGSRSADDAAAEVRSGVLSGLSIGFIADEAKDVISTAKNRGGIPQVLRRSAELIEVSLVATPAHPGAKIITPNLDEWRHEQSEALLRPWRKAQTEKLVAQRRADAELVDDIARMCARDFTVESAITTAVPTDRHILTMGGQQYSVRDADGPDAAAERLRRALVNAELFERSLRPEPDSLRQFMAAEGVEALTR